MNLREKKELIHDLQQQIIRLQRGSQKWTEPATITGLAGMEKAFPRNVFPQGAVHEFLSYNQEDKAATNGFIGALVSRVNFKQGLCLWVAAHRTVFPPALQLFDISPDRVVFIDLDSSKYALWALEEALKCDGLSIVIAEIGELTFMESRRLQLAVEKSGVTGFIHRFQPRTENTVACVTRWRISPLPSFIEGDLSGVGHPRWDVELVKVRNGKPGKWMVQWQEDGLRQIAPQSATADISERKTG